MIPEKIKTFISEKMAHYGIPGVSLGVIAGESQEVVTFGVTHIETELPVTTDTLFQVGSNTKTMTATLMMILAEEGKLDLDAPIRFVLPDFRLQDETVAAGATIRQLLTHSTGWIGDHFIDTGPGADAKARYTTSMAKIPQLVPPNFAFSYNNSAFAIAGHVIETVTGMLYEEAMIEKLFKPLGMAHSLFDAADVMLGRFAVGHIGPPMVDEIQVAGPWPLPRAMYAAGAVAASAEDMLTYARFYLNGGKVGNGKQLISPAGMAELWEPRFPTSSGGQVAMSWFVEQQGDLTSYRHGGATVGQLSSFKIVPEKGFAYASLTNAHNGRNFNADLEAQLLNHFCGIEPAAPELRDPTEAELEQLLGRYERPMVDLDFTTHNGKLKVQLISKQGFPTADVPPRPPSPLMDCFMTAAGQLWVMDGSDAGSEAQILRRDDGSIGWIRMGSRLHAKSPHGA